MKIKNYVRCSGSYSKRKLTDWTQHTVENLENNMFLAYRLVVNNNDEENPTVDKKHLALYHRKAGEIAFYFKNTKKNKDKFLTDCWPKIELLFEKINDNIINSTSIDDFMFRNFYKLKFTYKNKHDGEVDVDKLANIQEIR